MLNELTKTGIKSVVATTAAIGTQAILKETNCPEVSYNCCCRCRWFSWWKHTFKAKAALNERKKYALWNPLHWCVIVCLNNTADLEKKEAEKDKESLIIRPKPKYMKKD